MNKTLLMSKCRSHFRGVTVWVTPGYLSRQQYFPANPATAHYFCASSVLAPRRSQRDPISAAARRMLVAFLVPSFLAPFSDTVRGAHGQTVGAHPGQPVASVPVEDTLTRAKVRLGQEVFFDRDLSSDRTVSCADCHSPQRAFTDGAKTSQGVHRIQGRRNSPTLVNVGLQPLYFWDGRASSLEDQALGPLFDPGEMGMSREELISRLASKPVYPVLFQQAFPDGLSVDNVVNCLAAFQRTILSLNSAYDRYQAGDPQILSPLARRGMDLFFGKAHCSLCHRGVNFSDGLFHNLGVGWTGDGFSDLGRFLVTGVPADRGAFRTPTLRQVAQTAPYMHDGSLETLQDVVEWYDRGGVSNPHIDPLIQPLRLTSPEKKALLAFLMALSGTVSSGISSSPSP
ncbi:MAG: cytochrome c peroxidase [Acidobacteriota bacterium]